jgi:hypothetical protein
MGDATNEWRDTAEHENSSNLGNRGLIDLHTQWIPFPQRRADRPSENALLCCSDHSTEREDDSLCEQGAVSTAARRSFRKERVLGISGLSRSFIFC